MGFPDNPAYKHRLSASKRSLIRAVTLAPESMMGNSHSLGMLQKEVHALAQVEVSGGAHQLALLEVQHDLTSKRVWLRADEIVAPYLPVNKRSYMLGGLAAATAQFAIWLLPDIQVTSSSIVPT